MAQFFNNVLPTEADALAWRFILTASRLSTEHKVPVFLSYDESQSKIIVTSEREATTCLYLNEANQWCCSSQIPSFIQALFDLYLPIIGDRTSDSMVVAHLGQSVDSQIATANGDSFYVTGEQNRKHLHCLRALSDAVIVGAGTIHADNPQLTTRSVPGQNPVRVVIDPHARLREPMGIFSDAQSRTILMHQSSADLSDLEMQFGPNLKDGKGDGFKQVERWVVPGTDTQLPVEKVVALLIARGLRRLFVEGGGITVSRFFEANCLDRLHVAVAPLLVGQGKQALQIAGSDKMINAHRPPCAIYKMGDDIMWDFDVSALKNSHRDNAQLQNEIPADTKPPFVQRIL